MRPVGASQIPNKILSFAALNRNMAPRDIVLINQDVIIRASADCHAIFTERLRHSFFQAFYDDMRSKFNNWRQSIRSCRLSRKRAGRNSVGDVKEQDVRADPNLVAVAQQRLQHPLAVDKCAVSTAVPQNIDGPATEDLAMTTRHRIAVKDDVTLIIAPDDRCRIRQEQTCATRAQPTSKTHAKFACGKTGCGPSCAER